jgi:peptidoglycan/LPS O-acetylase OafA/YrhL
MGCVIASQVIHIAVRGGTWTNAVLLTVAVVLLFAYPVGYFIEQRRVRAQAEDSDPTDPNGSPQD